MPYGDKHIPEERLKEMLDELRSHYGEPVRPVSEYCEAFYEWYRALRARQDENDGMRPYDFEQYQKIKEALDVLQIPIVKSNYLWRLIYGDRQKRTEKCPEHKGHWSGYSWDRACDYGCNHGYDVTGWLPEPHVFVEKPEDVPVIKDDKGKITQYGIGYGPRDQCFQCGGTREKGQHIEP